MPHSAHSTPRISTPSPTTDISQRYWNVNVPADQWTEECPTLLTGISEKNKSVLSTRNEDYKPQDWSTAQHLVRTNRIDNFRRRPCELRRYIEYVYNLKKGYGSVLSFIQHKRLHWDNVTPSGDIPFTNSSDYKILYNDWPYGVDEDITHLVVWTKFLLVDDEVTDDLTPRAKQEIETFVDKTFCGNGGVTRDHLIWFKNWKSLKSVHALEHFHVMLYKAPPAFLKKITGGDKPVSVAISE